MARQELVIAVLALFAALQAGLAHGKITVFAYMLADNDLQCGLMANLLQLAYGYGSMQLDESTLPEFYIEFDNGSPAGCETLPGLPGLSSMQWTTAKSMTLIPEDGQGAKFKVLKDMGEVNTASSAKFAEFLKTGFAMYPPGPSRQYVLVMSDHGGGYLGVGGDHTCRSSDIYSKDQCSWLSMSTVSSTIQSALKAANVSKFDLVGFDACYMGSWETLVSLQPVARHVLASEETEPGHGWDWTAFNVLATAPQTTARELGSGIITYYMDICKQVGQGPCTLGLFDMARVSNLSKALSAFSDALATTSATANGAGLADQLSVASRKVNLGKMSTVDILMFMDTVEALPAGSTPALKQAIAGVRSAVNASMLDYNKAVVSKSYTGLSMYWPQLGKYSLMDGIKDFAASVWSGITGNNGGKVTSVTDSSYSELAASFPEIKTLQTLFSNLQKGATGSSGARVRSAAPATAENATNATAPAVAARESDANPLLLSSKSVQLNAADAEAKLVSVAEGQVIAADHLLGFVNPLAPEQLVVAGFQEAKVAGGSTISGTLSLKLTALTQQLPQEQFPRTALFAARDVSQSSTGAITMLADVLYASACDDSIEIMDSGSLVITYSEANGNATTKLVLFAGSKDTGVAEVEPEAAGVIIPLLAELDPSNTSQLYPNWDASHCLKWRYAADIQLLTAPSTSFGYPGAPVLPLLLAAGTQAQGYSSADVQLLALPVARKTASGCSCQEPCAPNAAGTAASCRVDPNSCPTSPQAAPIAADTCTPLGTLAGCQCKPVWKSRNATLPGTCVSADSLHPEGSWCEIDPASCDTPASLRNGSNKAAGNSTGAWDYCSVTTRRGCSCANPYVDPTSGMQFNGTCKRYSRSDPAVCVVEPGSCEIEDPLNGGDVWDVCVPFGTNVSSMPTDVLDVNAPPVTLKQCVPELVAACQDAGLSYNNTVVTIDPEAVTCSPDCWQAACRLQANTTSCGDRDHFARVAGTVFRALDSACGVLVPTQFKCPWATSVAPVNNVTCPSYGTFVTSNASGTISSSPSYPPSSNCFWEINSPARPFITVTPSSFDTEELYDYVTVSDAYGFIGYWSGKEPSNSTYSTDTGYMMIEFSSDASISGQGFSLQYEAATEPKPPQPCASGTRALTLFIRTAESDVYDISWALLAGSVADPAAGNATVAAAGGWVPWEDYALVSERVLQAAGDLAEAGAMQYHPWSLATEVKCVAPGQYTLLMMEGTVGSWAGGSVAVAVPERQLLAPLQLKQGSQLGVASFEVPAAADAAAGQAAAKLSIGPSGFSADLSIQADAGSADVRSAVLGKLKEAVARVLDTVTQRVIVVDVKDATNGTAAVDSTAAAGRRLLQQLLLVEEEQASSSRSSSSAAAAMSRGLHRSSVVAAAKRHSRSLQGGLTAKRSARRSTAGAEAQRASAAASAAAGGIRRRSLAADIPAVLPTTVVSFKVIGYNDTAAATAASSALQAAAKSGTLLESLNDEELAVESAAISNVQVLATADASVPARSVGSNGTESTRAAGGATSAAGGMYTISSWAVLLMLALAVL